jgi:gas vesicle protein
MADGYDRFDNNEASGGGSFVMGLLTGTVLGAGLGMLFAPKAGSELRGQISEQAGNLANQASEGYRRASESAGQWAEKGKETAGEWADRGKDAYGKAKDAVSRGADEAQKYVRETASGVTGAPATASGTGPSTSGSTYGSGSSFGSGAEGMRGTGAEPSRGGPSSTGSSGSTGGTRRNS